MVFFFQAEDGIRDKLVTGVQTCALPIWLTFFCFGGGWLTFFSFWGRLARFFFVLGTSSVQSRRIFGFNTYLKGHPQNNVARLAHFFPFWGRLARFFFVLGAAGSLFFRFVEVVCAIVWHFVI